MDLLAWLPGTWKLGAWKLGAWEEGTAPPDEWAPGGGVFQPRKIINPRRKREDEELLLFFS